MPHVYADRRDKLTDFWLGFVGWFVINGIAWGLFTWVLRDFAARSGLSLLFVLNIAALVGLAFIRPLASLGIVVAFANLLALVVIVGIFETPADFTAGSSGNAAPMFVGFGLLGLAAFATGSFFVMRRILRGL